MARDPRGCYHDGVSTPPRVIKVVVPGRTHVDPEAPLTGAAGMAFLEQLRVDAYAFSGIDARQPMRRDLVRVLRKVDAGDDDF